MTDQVVTWEIPLRKAEDSDSFPYTGNKVTFIKISTEKHLITQAKTKTEKRDMLSQAGETDVFLAAWPGKWSQDVFVISDPRAVYLQHFLVD